MEYSTAVGGASVSARLMRATVGPRISYSERINRAGHGIIDHVRQSAHASDGPRC